MPSRNNHLPSTKHAAVRKRHSACEAAPSTTPARPLRHPNDPQRDPLLRAGGLLVRVRMSELASGAHPQDPLSMPPSTTPTTQPSTAMPPGLPDRLAAKADSLDLATTAAADPYAQFVAPGHGGSATLPPGATLDPVQYGTLPALPPGATLAASSLPAGYQFGPADPHAGPLGPSRGHRGTRHCPGSDRPRFPRSSRRSGR